MLSGRLTGRAEDFGPGVERAEDFGPGVDRAGPAREFQGPGRSVSARFCLTAKIPQNLTKITKA